MTTRVSASPVKSSPAFLPLVLLAIATIEVQLFLIFQYAPQERVMGIVQKVFYVHVPAAVAMNFIVAICALASLGYLIKGTRRFDEWAVSAGELAVIFCAIVLITGPLWGRKAWGIWWDWRDVRLTSTAILFLIFVAYLFLRAFGGSGAAKFSAAFAFFGAADLPLIYYSVQRWGGQHPVVVTKGGAGIAPKMMPALYLGFVAFLLVAAVLLWSRIRLERGRTQLDELYLAAEEAGVEV